MYNGLFVYVFISAVAQLGDEKEGICYAVMEKERLATVRRNMPVEVSTSTVY